MKPVHIALLLVAAAIGIQATTNEAYIGSKIDHPSHDVDASADRRGGGDMRTTSDSSRIAGNHEEE